MSNISKFFLRLPVCINAVPEKLTAMNTAAFFAERKQRADFEAFRAILTRQEGEPSKDGDELK
jgi:hypothetical protein